MPLKPFELLSLRGYLLPLQRLEKWVTWFLHVITAPLWVSGCMTWWYLKEKKNLKLYPETLTVWNLNPRLIYVLYCNVVYIVYIHIWHIMWKSIIYVLWNLRSTLSLQMNLQTYSLNFSLFVKASLPPWFMWFLVLWFPSECLLPNRSAGC